MCDMREVGREWGMKLVQHCANKEVRLLLQFLIKYGIIKT